MDKSNLIPVAFISRHIPTPDQEELANKANLVLIHVGDVDAFDSVSVFSKMQHYSVVCGVHPLVAIEAMEVGKCWIQFDNVKRSAEGEKPVFGCSKMVIRNAESAGIDFFNSEDEFYLEN